MTHTLVWRWSLFLTLLIWGMGYIALFAFFVVHSEDHVAAGRRDAVCARGQVPADGQISFTAKDIDRNMIAAGWSSPESWGVWSAERHALLVLPTPADLDGVAVLEFDLLAPTNAEFPLATVDVSSAGQTLAQWQLREGLNKQSAHRVTVPSSLLAGHKCVSLSMYFAHAFRPSKHGLGKDSRLLGIGVSAVRWISDPEAQH